VLSSWNCGEYSNFLEVAAGLVERAEALRRRVVRSCTLDATSQGDEVETRLTKGQLVVEVAR